jgi:hypothetical protein
MGVNIVVTCKMPPTLHGEGHDRYLEYVPDKEFSYYSEFIPNKGDTVHYQNEAWTVRSVYHMVGDSYMDGVSLRGVKIYVEK